jgi:hypothetical protein
VIYFVRRESGGPIKIGTTKNLGNRLALLRAECGERLDVLGALPGSFAGEHALHEKFRHLRHSGREWFNPDPELLDFIDNETMDWDGFDEPPYVNGRICLPKYAYDALKAIAEKAKRPVSWQLRLLIEEAAKADPSATEEGRK